MDNFTISESQLFDYLRCPTLYDMKRRLNLDVEDPTKLTKMAEGVVKYWCVQQLDAKTPGSGDMKRKWDSVCGKKKLEPKQIYDGFNMIAKFMNWTERIRPLVLDVDAKYELAISGVTIVGNLGILLMLPNKTVELFVPDFGSKLPDQRYADQKLSFTMQAAAYEQIYKTRLAGIHIHSFKHDRDLFTMRTPEDYPRLMATIYGVGRGIQSQLFYPRESFMCENCPGLIYCKNWRPG